MFLDWGLQTQRPETIFFIDMPTELKFYQMSNNPTKIEILLSDCQNWKGLEMSSRANHTLWMKKTGQTEKGPA